MFFLFPVVSGRSSSCSFFLFFFGFFYYGTRVFDTGQQRSSRPVRNTSHTPRNTTQTTLEYKKEKWRTTATTPRSAPQKKQQKNATMKTKKKNETGGTTKIKPKKKDKKNVHCFFLYFRVFFVVVVGGQLVEYARGTPSPSRFHPKLEKPMLRPFAVALNASAAANSFFF